MESNPRALDMELIELVADHVGRSIQRKYNLASHIPAMEAAEMIIRSAWELLGEREYGRLVWIAYRELDAESAKLVREDRQIDRLAAARYPM